MPLRAVLFDAVGTLMIPDPAVAVAYGNLGRRYGSALSQTEIQTRYHRALAIQDELDRSLYFGRTSENREATRWRHVVAEVFDDVVDTKPLFEELWRHFAAAESWRLFDDVSAAWQALAGEGLILGIASNWDARLLPICRGLQPLSGGIPFVSSLLGWRKPRPEFFRGVEQALGLKAKEIALVGDEAEVDYLAARAAGWRSLHITRAGETDSRVRREDQSRCLSEVLDRLDL